MHLLECTLHQPCLTCRAGCGKLKVLGKGSQCRRASAGLRANSLKQRTSARPSIRPSGSRRAAGEARKPGKVGKNHPRGHWSFSIGLANLLTRYFWNKPSGQCSCPRVSFFDHELQSLEPSNTTTQMIEYVDIAGLVRRECALWISPFMSELCSMQKWRARTVLLSCLQSHSARGASKGEGLGNQFLANIRNVGQKQLPSKGGFSRVRNFLEVSMGELDAFQPC